MNSLAAISTAINWLLLGWGFCMGLLAAGLLLWWFGRTPYPDNRDWRDS